MELAISQCPWCKQIKGLYLDNYEFVQLEKYHRGEDLIQNLFPNLNVPKREFLKSGYCLQCQNLIFGSSYIEDESWVTL